VQLQLRGNPFCFNGGGLRKVYFRESGLTVQQLVSTDEHGRQERLVHGKIPLRVEQGDLLHLAGVAYGAY
jgi:hypothetical protein